MECGNFPGSNRKTSIWTLRFCLVQTKPSPDMDQKWLKGKLRPETYTDNILYMNHIRYFSIKWNIMDCNGWKCMETTMVLCCDFPLQSSQWFQKRFPGLPLFSLGKTAELDHSAGCGCCELWASLVLPAQCCRPEWADSLQNCRWFSWVSGIWLGWVQFRTFFGVADCPSVPFFALGNPKIFAASCGSKESGTLPPLLLRNMRWHWT